MRLIDEADARRRIVAFATGLHSEVLPVDTVLMLLTQLQTIDAVPVVRCCECAFCDDTMRCQCDNSCKGLIREDDDFCSYGQPR